MSHISESGSEERGQDSASRGDSLYTGAVMVWAALSGGAEGGVGWGHEVGESALAWEAKRFLWVV